LSLDARSGDALEKIVLAFGFSALPTKAGGILMHSLSCTWNNSLSKIYQNMLNCLVSVFLSLQVAASPVFSGAGLVKSPLRSLGRKIPISPLVCCKNRTLQEHKSTKAITVVNKVPQNPVEYHVSIKIGKNHGKIV